MFCIKCGQDVGQDEQFCKNCGAANVEYKVSNKEKLEPTKTSSSFRIVIIVLIVAIVVAVAAVGVGVYYYISLVNEESSDSDDEDDNDDDNDDIDEADESDSEDEYNDDGSNEELEIEEDSNSGDSEESVADADEFIEAEWSLDEDNEAIKAFMAFLEGKTNAMDVTWKYNNYGETQYCKFDDLLQTLAAADDIGDVYYSFFESAGNYYLAIHCQSTYSSEISRNSLIFGYQNGKVCYLASFMPIEADSWHRYKNYIYVNNYNQYEPDIDTYTIVNLDTGKKYKFAFPNYEKYVGNWSDDEYIVANQTTYNECISNYKNNGFEICYEGDKYYDLWAREYLDNWSDAGILEIIDDIDMSVVHETEDRYLKKFVSQYSY